jgi:hypothetical protein
MDWDLVLIFSFITITLVVLGFTINGIVSKVLAHKRWERENSLIGSQSSIRVSEVADRTDLIEDRLRVLERLATDRGALLSDEIEALRDQRREAEGA